MSCRIEVKVINKSGFELPKYETEGSSGLDLKAACESSIVIQPFERVLIPTGLYIELPEGYEAQIRPRSGLALKKGLTVLNTPGTIDADYRGEIGVIIYNSSQIPQTIFPGDRIAQMVIAKVEKALFYDVDMINETKRGDGGFGHTGTN